MIKGFDNMNFIVIIKKEYNTPKTLYQRVLEQELPEKLKNELTE